MALDEYGIDSIGRVWNLENADTPFQYAERVLYWEYTPTRSLLRKYSFRFVLQKKDERRYKWVPNADWDTVRLWLKDQADSLKCIYSDYAYKHDHLFEESDIETVIYQLQKLHKSLSHVHRKTVGRLLRRGIIAESNGMLVVTNSRLEQRRQVYRSTPRGHREGLNGIGNHNKPTRESRFQRFARRWYNDPDREERISKREAKEAKEAHDLLLLQKKLEHRAKIAAKKKNRKYNRALLKDCDLRDRDYIAGRL